MKRGQVQFVDTRARSVVACDEQIAIYRGVLFKVLNRTCVTGPGPVSFPKPPAIDMCCPRGLSSCNDPDRLKLIRSRLSDLLVDAFVVSADCRASKS
jgi:hypothetical protein